MKTILFLALLMTAIGATQTIRAQELENNCALEAWVADKDPNGLNVRNKPNITGKIIAKLVNGKSGDDQLTVYIVGFSNGWAKISGARKISGQNVFDDIGWVSAKMLAVAAKGAGGKYDQPAPLYEKTNASSRKIDMVPSGTTTEMQIVGYDCFGLKMIYKGKTGWLSDNNICGNPVTTCP